MSQQAQTKPNSISTCTERIWDKHKKAMPEVNILSFQDDVIFYCHDTGVK